MTANMREIQCAYCGKWEYRSNVTQLCAQCADDERHAQNRERERERHRRTNRDRKKIIIVGCANGWTDDTCYLRGSLFDKEEFQQTLKMGYWPDGLVVQYYSERRIVREGELVRI